MKTDFYFNSVYLNFKAYKGRSRNFRQGVYVLCVCVGGGEGVQFVCLFCCFTSQSTAMVMAGWSVHLNTLFPGQA